MNALTVAVSHKGLTDFVRHVGEKDIKQKIAEITVPDIVLHPGFVSGTGCTFKKIEITRGGISNLTFTFKDLSQGGNGSFTFNFNASFRVNYAFWHEVGKQNQYIPPEVYEVPFDNNCRNFNFMVDSVDVVFNTVLANASGNLDINISSVGINDPKISGIHIPDNSYLAHAWCTSKMVTQYLTDSINRIDFSRAIRDSVGPLFDTIPASGHLTDKIVFEYPFQNIAFPADNNGLTVITTGRVTYNSEAYPLPIPDLPGTPNIITEKDTHFFIHEYEFNALFWAFYQEGDLNLKVTKGMIPDPQQLTTNYYKDYFPPIYKFAPGADMWIQVNALKPPTTVCSPAFGLDLQSFQNLKNKLPADVYQTLYESMLDEIFLTRDEFFETVVNAIGPESAQKYRQVILANAGLVAAVVEHDFEFDVYAVKQGKNTYMFTVDIDETDYLDEFRLEAKDQVQTVKFYFQMADAKAKLRKSDVPGLSEGDPFIQLWHGVLRPELAVNLKKIGETGVPLPFIKDFLFKDAVIRLFPGYVSIASDILIS